MTNNSIRWINPKANLIFAMSLAVLPLLVTFVDLIFGSYMPLVTLICFWGMIYSIFLITSIVIDIFKGYLFTNRIKIKLNFYTIVFALLLITIIISSIVNGGGKGALFSYICLPLVFICIYSLSKEHLNLIIHSLLITLAICCVMGFIDPLNQFMPGFSNQCYQLSIQFYNNNYSSVVMASASVFVYLKIDKADKKQFFYYLTLYFIYMLFLFMNGSFAPITAVAIIQLFCIIFFSIKNKKLNLKFALLSLIAIALCFLVDLIPNIKAIRTCEYNYFLECVAVFDNIFNTDILSVFGIDSIVGADGWERGKLLTESLQFCTSNAKNFFFGDGAGTYGDLRPHNMLLSIWLDFGIFPAILCVSLFVYWVINYFRSNQDHKQTNLFITITAFLLANIVGSLVFNTSYILIIYFAIFAKKQQYIAINQESPQKT